MKLRMARWAGLSGISSAALELRRIVPTRWLTILNYHRVADEHEGLDAGVVDATPAGFDAQMAMLRRYFSPVTIDDAIRYAQGEPLPPNPVLVTFDDGYRDNLTVAAPILRAHDIRATFFVATNFVRERRLFWWDTLAYLATKSKRHELVLNFPVLARFPLGAHRAATIRKLLRIVKDTYDLDLDAFIAEVARAASVEWTPAVERQLADDNLMTRSEVEQLAKQGMDIGSHTRSHRFLDTLPPDRLADELRGSRIELEEWIGAPVRSVSYPVGKSIRDKPQILDAVREAGYEIGFAACGGSNHLDRRSHRFDLQRISIDRDIGSHEFAGLLLRPNTNLRA